MKPFYSTKIEQLYSLDFIISLPIVSILCIILYTITYIVYNFKMFYLFIDSDNNSNILFL